MTWPTYFPPDSPLPSALGAPLAWRPIIRHDQRTRDPVLTGGPRPIGVAVDVWRDGAHLWRSYTPQPGATCDAWTDAVHGPDGPRNHDEGYWRAPGVQNVADWPIPTRAACAPVMGLQAVADLLYTLTAIALRDVLAWAGEGAEPFQHPPAEGALRQRLISSESGEVMAAYCEQGVTVRAIIVPLEAVRRSEAAPVTQTWRATLQRRPVRAGAHDVHLREGSVAFAAPAEAPPHILVRHAKRALGVTGYPAQRRGEGLAWHISTAPYLLTIAPEEVHNAG